MYANRALRGLAAGLMLLACAPSVLAQEIDPGVPGKNARAVRINPHPPVIDGALEDPIWHRTPTFSGFLQRDPDEGTASTETTTIQFAYDDQALYVGINAFDSQPERIVARLSRRDQWTESDRVELYIDAHHDHQTGNWFEINAAGCLQDGRIANDGEGRGAWDDTWDAVWEGRAARHEEGWSAEYRIPFSALRFSPHEEYVWGFNMRRYISRKKEAAYWVLIPRGETGFISRFPHLEGISHIVPPRSLEVLPYAVGRATAGSGVSDFFGNSGADLRYSLTSATSLNATLNPDFGQVEADPARLNLSVFELFQRERRPFFVEGSQIFKTPIDLFYSRRIGRRPGHFSIPAGYEEVDASDFTTILGAAKVTGKTAGKTTFGLLEAVTAAEYARIETTYTDAAYDEGTSARDFLVEPLTNYLVARVKQDLLRGNSHVGFLGTALNRRHAAGAYAGGVDWNLRWRDNGYARFGRWPSRAAHGQYRISPGTALFAGF